MSFREELWKTIVEAQRDAWRLVRLPLAVVVSGLAICVLAAPIRRIMPITGDAISIFGGLVFVIGDGWLVGRMILDSGKRIARDIAEARRGR